MTWTKLGDTFADDHRLLTLDRSTRLLHVEGLVYANKVLSDGAIPAAALPRLTDHDDPPAGAAALVAAGLWEATDTGWRIPEFLLEQRSREEVLAGREKGRQRAERYRRHGHGDHSQCSPQWCPSLRNGVTNGVTNSVSNGTPVPDPVPDPKGGEGRGNEGPPSGRTGPKGPAASGQPEKVNGALRFVVAVPDDPTPCPHGTERSVTRCPLCDAAEVTA